MIVPTDSSNIFFAEAEKVTSFWNLHDSNLKVSCIAAPNVKQMHFGKHDKLISVLKSLYPNEDFAKVEMSRDLVLSKIIAGMTNDQKIEQIKLFEGQFDSESKFMFSQEFPDGFDNFSDEEIDSLLKQVLRFDFGGYYDGFNKRNFIVLKELFSDPMAQRKKLVGSTPQKFLVTLDGIITACDNVHLKENKTFICKKVFGNDFYQFLSDDDIESLILACEAESELKPNFADSFEAMKNFFESVQKSLLAASSVDPNDPTIITTGTKRGPVPITPDGGMSKKLKVSEDIKIPKPQSKCLFEENVLDDDAKSVDAKSVDAKSVDAKSVDAKSVDAKSVDAKSVDAKSVDAKSVDALNASKPDASKPDASKPDASKPDASKPDAIMTNAAVESKEVSQVSLFPFGLSDGEKEMMKQFQAFQAFLQQTKLAPNIAPTQQAPVPMQKAPVPSVATSPIPAAATSPVPMQQPPVLPAATLPVGQDAKLAPNHAPTQQAPVPPVATPPVVGQDAKLAPNHAPTQQAAVEQAGTDTSPKLPHLEGLPAEVVAYLQAMHGEMARLKETKGLSQSQEPVPSSSQHGPSQQQAPVQQASSVALGSLPNPYQQSQNNPTANPSSASVSPIGQSEFPVVANIGNIASSTPKKGRRSKNHSVGVQRSKHTSKDSKFLVIKTSKTAFQTPVLCEVTGETLYPLVFAVAMHAQNTRSRDKECLEFKPAVMGKMLEMGYVAFHEEQPLKLGNFTYLTETICDGLSESDNETDRRAYPGLTDDSPKLCGRDNEYKAKQLSGVVKVNMKGNQEVDAIIAGVHQELRDIVQNSNFFEHYKKGCYYHFCRKDDEALDVLEEINATKVKDQLYVNGDYGSSRLYNILLEDRNQVLSKHLKTGEPEFHKDLALDAMFCNDIIAKYFKKMVGNYDDKYKKLVFTNDKIVHDTSFLD